jgi:hypothetical protein
LVDKVPGDEGWVYELKYDGVRLLCRVDGTDVRCISRNGIDWTHKVGPIVDALAKLKLDGAWIDGELIVSDPNGRSDFSLLQHSMEQGRLDELQFCIFDLLFYRGEDLRALPLSERKTRLDAAFARLPASGPLRLADQIQSDSAELLSRVCNQHLEGLIAKKIDSPYTSDRSGNWLKIKCHREQEFVVGGAAFLGCQAIEWSHLIHEGARLASNPWGAPQFGQAFFLLTGFHGTHVFSGLVILLITLIRSLQGKTPAQGVEMAGLYWHFVDLVWVFIFTLFYLL